MGLSTNLYLSLFATMLMGIGQAGFMIISHTIIQLISPDYTRGRIAGVYAMYIGGSMALFNFLNGPSPETVTSCLKANFSSKVPSGGIL